jgi:hypothetical protein
MRSAWLLLLVVACGSGKGSEAGALGEPCYPNGTCNVGLSCFQGTCVAADAAMLVDAMPDAVPDAALCLADATEPNNAPANAFVTPVDSVQQSIAFTGLDICPAADIDNYAASLTTANASLDVTVTWTGAPQSMQVLNAGGTAIANGTTNGAMTRACVPNLPIGTYYVRVFGNGAQQSRYNMQIAKVASCL